MPGWMLCACLSLICWGGVFATITLAAKSRQMCNWGRIMCVKWAAALMLISVVFAIIGGTISPLSAEIVLTFACTELVMFVATFYYLYKWALRKIVRRFSLFARAQSIKECGRLSQIEASIRNGVMPNELLTEHEHAIITLALTAVGVQIRTVPADET